MRYTDQVHYQAARIGYQALQLRQPPLWVPKPFAHSPLWSRMGTPFHPEHYLYPAPPVDLGKVVLSEASQPRPPAELRVLRCPIKVAQDPTVLLPQELAAFEPLVRHVLETEAAHNPRFLEAWAHISVETTYVQAGHTQRVPGWHVDGFQGVRQERHGIEHSYLWADVAPTQFCVQPFVLGHLDPARHNVFALFEQEAREANVLQGLPHHIYLIDPYVVHRAAAMPAAGWRSFVRITFADTYLDDPVNTVNVALRIAQNAAPRLEVRDRLFAYEGPTPWELIGLKPLPGKA